MKLILSYQDQRGTSSELLWGMDSEEITLMDDGEVQGHLWKVSTENRRRNNKAESQNKVQQKKDNFTKK